MLLTREKRLHSARDEFGLIQVTESTHSRCLYFDSPVEQSRMYLHSLDQLAFEYQAKMAGLALDHAFTCHSRSMLMLGLGGGLMASHIHQAVPKLQQTLVELRQIVIDAAYDYFYLPQVPEVETVCQDALDYMSESQQSYDLILVDLYDEQAMPDAFYAASFQQALFQHLNPKGRLLFNLWTTDPSARLQLIPYWLQQSETSTQLQLTQYQIESSENLILSVLRN